MKSILLSVLSVFFTFSFFTTAFAAADVTITSVAVPAGNMNQGSNTNIVYIAKLAVATEDININNALFTLGGNYNNTDLGSLNVYVNTNAPTIAGASLANNAAANFAGPHAFNINIARGITSGSSIYVIVTVNIAANANDNHTVSIDGAANPLTITAAITPNITNNQTNAAGVQTIQAADITLSTVSLPAGNINQGSLTNVIYIAKVDVATEPLTLSDITFNLTGTYDNDDLSSLSIYFNTNAPTIAGASLGNNAAANFAAPHTFDVSLSNAFAPGSTVYILITVNAAAAANDNHTVTINGAVHPLTIGSTTSPNFVNNQTNAAGVQTIQAADITFTSIAVPAAGINQGSNTNIVYIAKMDVATEPVTLNNIIFNLTGTYDNDDLGSLSIYFNTTAPTIAGASLGNNAAAGFAGPHLFAVPLSYYFAASSFVYIIITVNTTNAANDNHTVTINGATDPLTITTTTDPNIVNNQTNAAGIQTIQASDISISTVTTAAGILNPGTGTNIIYIAKLDVGTSPVSLTNVMFNLTGTYDNDDLGSLSIYFNTTAPTIAGASLGNNAAAGFAGPHTFDVPLSSAFAPGSTVYMIITANIASSATDNHTIIINGAIDPITLIATTVPNIVNNQTNTAGVQTIRASDIILTSVSLSASNIVPGSNSNIIYTLKMDVGVQPVSVNNVQVTLKGNYDNDDLGNLGIYYNATTPNLAGASLLNNTSVAGTSGPHTFSVPVGNTIAAGTVGYLVFALNVNSSATINNTVFVNGATDPVVLGFTTVPNVSNDQSDAAGVFNFANAALPLKLTSFTAKKISGKEQVQLAWVTASEINTKNFDIQWSADGLSYSNAGSVNASGNSQLDQYYSFTHIAPAQGNNYYRLKMIDIDGQFTFSPVVAVKLEMSAIAFVIAPNPVGSQLRILRSGIDAVKLLRIFDAAGRLVWQSPAVNNAGGVITVPFAAFANGLYNAELSTQSAVQRLSFIKSGK